MEKLVTYAYDGSGIALRAKAKVLKTWGETARIKLTGDNADAIKCLGGKVAIVPTTDLSEAGSYAKIASFGWLD
jgi:hypothetical protein